MVTALLLSDIDQLEAFNNRDRTCTERSWALLHELYCNQWKTGVVNKPKLRTYVTFKTQFKVEPYVLSFMSRGHTDLTWHNCDVEYYLFILKLVDGIAQMLMIECVKFVIMGRLKMKFILFSTAMLIVI